MESDKKEQPSTSILGLSTDELAGLTADELTNNPVAIRMLLHYYRQLLEDNNALKNDNNTLKTYVSAYERYRTSSAVGAILLAVSNVSIGFGVNLLTGGTTWPGISSLSVGIALVGGGMYLNFMRR